jgi:thiol-disulfide isomerase/thioredoxin
VKGTIAMPYLSAAVVLVGAIGLLNLVLTLGVIRRLREHSERLRTAGDADGDVLPAVGTTIGEFEALTTDNRRVSRDMFDGPAPVGFFSPNCGPCRQMLPEFIEHAAAIGRDRTMAVVVGLADDATDELAARLATVSRVVVEQPNGPLSTAFGAVNVPALYLIDRGGLVRGSGHTMDALSSLVPA